MPVAGLCDSCRYQRLVRNTRGSRFSLCLRSLDSEAYPRYPPTPVRSCAGFEPAGPGGEPGGRASDPTEGGSDSAEGS